MYIHVGFVRAILYVLTRRSSKQIDVYFVHFAWLKSPLLPGRFFGSFFGTLNRLAFLVHMLAFGRSHMTDDHENHQSMLGAKNACVKLVFLLPNCEQAFLMYTRKSNNDWFFPTKTHRMMQNYYCCIKRDCYEFIVHHLLSASHKARSPCYPFL